MYSILGIQIISLNFIFTFQAGLKVIANDFKEEAEDDEPEPLRMEHFHLPSGCGFLGFLIREPVKVENKKKVR